MVVGVAVAAELAAAVAAAVAAAAVTTRSASCFRCVPSAIYT